MEAICCLDTKHVILRERESHKTAHRQTTYLFISVACPGMMLILRKEDVGLHLCDELQFSKQCWGLNTVPSSRQARALQLNYFGSPQSTIFNDCLIIRAVRRLGMHNAHCIDELGLGINLIWIPRLALHATLRNESPVFRKVSSSVFWSFVEPEFTRLLNMWLFFCWRWSWQMLRCTWTMKW